MPQRTAIALLLALFLAPFAAKAQPESPSATLSALYKDMWEDTLRRTPEFASALGDRRYNDQLEDLSPRACNESLAHGRDFLTRLLVIDTAHLSPQEKLSAEFLQRALIGVEETSRFKLWQIPVDQYHGVQTDLPALADTIPFDTVKDYEDWIARLKLMPRQLRQTTENMMAGIDANHVERQYTLELVAKQVEDLAAQPPAASPFARPLQQFPKTFDAATQKRLTAATLEAIQNDVLPAYTRFGKFLRAQAIPAASKVNEPAFHLGGEPYFGNKPGQQKILELRAKARKALGPGFNLKAFRDTLIDSGALPMDLLQQRIDAWIATQK